MIRKTNIGLRLITLGVCIAIGGAVTAAAISSKNAVERRNAVVETAKTKPANGVALLTQALNDDNVLVRRVAARALLEFGKPAEPGLVEGLRNSDYMVRMECLKGLNGLGLLTNDQLTSALQGDDKMVWQSAMDILAGRKPYTKETEALLTLGAASGCAKHQAFPFYRHISLLRDRGDWVVVAVNTIPLPRAGWKLKADPQQIGHKEKWFAPTFNDGDWIPVEIEKYWKAYSTNHIGIGWYRGTFKLPEKPREMDAVEIAFGAVLESAWVWINGEYVGQHNLDCNDRGGNEPFLLDVTEMLKWGQDNQITVRVLTSGSGGGIWKPVEIRVQKFQK